jgi:lipoyl(octanoyl) transferase
MDKIIDLGLIDYNLGLQSQLDAVENVIKNPHQERFIFCSHPPVVTLGKESQRMTPEELKGELWGWSGDKVLVQRGGRITYHGPGQVVVYPILNLSLEKRKNDIYQYLRSLEEAVRKTFKHFTLDSEGGGLGVEKVPGQNLSATGVWVGSSKVASIGVAVKRWVTYHGVAINLDFDPLAFQGISPCGYQGSTMKSIEEILGMKLNRDHFQKVLAQNLLEIFD